MLEYLSLILACQLIGEFAVNAAEFPFPGPVAGMILLFVFLSVKGEVPTELKNVTDSLLNSLSLLFVPAGVGVMVHFKLLGSDAIPLSVAIIMSTVLTVVVTATVMTLVNKFLKNTSADASE